MHRKRSLSSALVIETWSWRDQPVLDAPVSFLCELSWTGDYPNLGEIADRVAGYADVDQQDVAAALHALSGKYLIFVAPQCESDRNYRYVTAVASDARR